MIADSRPRDAAGVAVVGAGAAGLAAAIFAAERGARVLLLEGARRVGAKILVSGGGRCNVTHAEVRPEDFCGPRPVVRNVLRAFDETAAVRWFASMGVPLKREETGKLFPADDRARTVLDALLGRAASLGVELRTGWRVERVSLAGTDPGGGAPGGPFLLEGPAGRALARTVVLATGGRSLPRSGSDGGGWELARAFGHTVTATYPALVPLTLARGGMHAALAGVAHEAEVVTRERPRAGETEGRALDRRTGPVLWTHFGVSGPAIMDASRFWVMANAAGAGADVWLNFLPGLSFDQADLLLREEASRRPPRALATALAERLPRRLSEALLAGAGGSPDARAADLTREARRALAHRLTGMRLPVEGHRGWNHAEVTAGGVPLAEVDHRRMVSRRRPGLHLCGEMLDCDGRIGGFNFQWAWSTGHLAGRAAAAACAAADPGP